MHWTMTPLADDQLVIAVRAEMEQASGRALSVSNSLPRELIATCETHGIPLSLLNLWIHSAEEWGAPELVRWYRAINAVREGFRAMRAEARQ